MHSGSSIQKSKKYNLKIFKKPNQNLHPLDHLIEGPMYFHHPSDQKESTVLLLNFLAKRRPPPRKYEHLWEQMGTQRVQNLHLESIREGRTLIA